MNNKRRKELDLYKLFTGDKDFQVGIIDSLKRALSVSEVYFINILISIYRHFKTFLFIWVAILFINQALIFGGYFQGYCILAALPHTAIILILIVYFGGKSESDVLIDKSANKNSKPERKTEYEILIEKKKTGNLTAFEKSKLEYLIDYRLRNKE